MILRRIGWSLLVVWFVVTAAFVMTTAIPTDPAQAQLGPHATQDNLASFRRHYCLDRGVIIQYECWLDHIVRGDLGESYRSKQAVTAIIAAHTWPTVQLTLAAIVLQLVIGVPLGVLAATRRGRWPDHAATVIGLLGQSAPVFFTGTILLYLVAYRGGWLPISGYGEAGWDRLRHLVLPALTLASVGIAYYSRVVRSELVDVLASDHVRTARAKGLDERAVVWRHAMRNALGPLVTLVGLDLGVLLGGAVAVEAVYAWPGLGREMLQAILDNDGPLILGVVLVAAMAIAAANLVTDLVYRALDPRLRDD